MNWKGYRRKRSQQNLRYSPGIFLAGLRKIAGNLRTTCLWAKISTQYLPNTRKKTLGHDVQ
jgi:hypothetical protein